MRSPKRLSPRKFPAFTPGRGQANERLARPGVAAALAVGCSIVVAFQIVLTLGAPLGAAALGGVNSGQLPDRLRIVTAVATLVWLFATLVVLARGGFAIFPLPGAVARWGVWVLVGLLGVGTVLNFASSSPWERFGWGPFTLAMLVLCITLARSGSGHDSDRIARIPT